MKLIEEKHYKYKYRWIEDTEVNVIFKEVLASNPSLASVVLLGPAKVGFGKTLKEGSTMLVRIEHLYPLELV